MAVQITASLVPNWSGEKRLRPFVAEGDRLVPRTPPMADGSGATVVNELVWTREES
jgi:hypothetical protein